MRGGTDSTLRVSADVSPGAPSLAAHPGAQRTPPPGSPPVALSHAARRPRPLLTGPPGEDLGVDLDPRVPLSSSSSRQVLTIAQTLWSGAPPLLPQWCPARSASISSLDFGGCLLTRLLSMIPEGVFPQTQSRSAHSPAYNSGRSDRGHLSPVSLSSLSSSSYLPSLPFSNPHSVKHHWFF